MKRKLTYISENGTNIPAEIEAPDDCPSCGRLIVFNTITSSHTDQKNELQVVLKCTNQICNSFLLLWYDTIDRRLPKLRKTEPPNLTQDAISKHIAVISPEFITIFNESREAKERGLTQVAGPAYRKAFEFLIKDYAKSLTSDLQKHADIEKLFAGNVVNQFITDTRIQAVAKRALWLGNDETHYLRKWVQQNIDDLINLIRLTMHWIEIEQESKSYVDTMPD